MALQLNDGTPLKIGTKPMAEKEKDRYDRMVDRQKRQFADNPVPVCKSILKGLESMMFNINHTSLFPTDLRIKSVEMQPDKTFVVLVSNRTLDTLSDEDKKRMIGSELLSFVGADENDGFVYCKFKLACLVANNKEDLQWK